MKKEICPPHSPKGTETAPMLINDIARIFNERMRRTTTEPLQTQNSCRMLLRALGFMEGCTQLDLVRCTHLKPPTVSVTLKKLEENGLVRRVADEHDLRAIRVYLTDKGKALNESTVERLKQGEAILMEGVTEEEQEYLLRVLTKMRDNILREMGEEKGFFHEID